jgi:hypothetical protein
VEKKLFRQLVIELFCSTSTLKSKNVSSFAVMVSHIRHFVSLVKIPCIVEGQPLSPAQFLIKRQITHVYFQQIAVTWKLLCTHVTSGSFLTPCTAAPFDIFSGDVVSGESLAELDSLSRISTISFNRKFKNS